MLYLLTMLVLATNPVKETPEERREELRAKVIILEDELSKSSKTTSNIYFPNKKELNSDLAIVCFNNDIPACLLFIYNNGIWKIYADDFFPDKVSKK